MLRLLLLRHAKAGQDSGEGDFARPLTARGRCDAARMGNALDANSYIPDLILSSSARRTAQTFELLMPEPAKTPRVEFLKSLYLAPAKKIFEVVRGTPENIKSLMLIGHNPGLEDLTGRLCRRPQSKAEAERCDVLRQKFPTCALAVLDFDIVSWSRLEPGSGMLLDFLRPKDVAG
jgi:phosphohistidine phosphatase